jgi:predicted deacylase
MGRFDLDSGENFNRHYPDLVQAIGPAVLKQLGPDAQSNVTTVREALRQHLAKSAPTTELQSLRHTLLTLAFDADSVLDLHCDCESVLHFYTDEACWTQLAPLAHYLQAETILLANNSGSGSFDECLSDVWCQLAEALHASGNPAPLPQGCCSTTIELRGERDVSHALAQGDAQALIAWLQHAGVMGGQTAPEVPPAQCQPTPLAGSETVKSPSPGLVVFAAQVGQRLSVGDLVAEVIDPVNNHTHRVLAGVDGVMYARIRDRFICSGGELAKIAGATPFRTGQLLGA